MITRNTEHPPRDSGAALLSVILIVAAMSVVIVIAVEAISRATRLAEVTSQRAESFWFARSAEAAGASYVAALLDLTEGRLTDATPRIGEPIVQPLENGSLTARLDDATNCFNLNALAVETDRGWGIEPDQLERLETLFGALGFGQYESEQLAQSIADWIDSDSLSRPNGAEDSYYDGLDPSYRTAGTPLENLRELRAVGPVSPETYLVISNLLCVRPDRAQSVLNLNTLRPDQAALLTALFTSELEPDAARNLLEARPLGGWQTVDQFLALESVTEISDDAKDGSSIDVVSSHFSILGLVSMSGQAYRFELLYGVDNDQQAALLWRRYGDE